MLTVLAFVVTIIIIVAFHEWGHFLAMRAFGVKVLTFSVGFGPKLLRFRDKRGTEWVISAIPLGGYVRPLDCRDDETAEGHPGEFSAKPAWQRVITYAAGPVFNFILALFIYWLLLFSYGQRGMDATLGPVPALTPAATAGFAAGDQVIAIAGKPVESWRGVYNGLIHHIGEPTPLPFQVKTHSGIEIERQLDISAWSADPEQAPLPLLGLSQAVVIGEVLADSAAERAGLRAGDQVIALAGEPVLGWAQWQQAIMDSAEAPLAVTVLRDGSEQTLTLLPEALEHDGAIIGRAGVAMGGLHKHQYGVFSAMGASAERFAEQTGVIFSSLAKLVTGKLSLDNLGGPITIAQVAGESASVGLASFLALLAYLSITLGVINLLPVPMLDGGWILFGIIEMIRGRSLSERFLMAAQGLGLAVVVSIMFLAIYNDLVRQFS